MTYFPTTFSSTSAASALAPITATINLSALAHNLSELRRWIAPSCDILGIVKANAYGHGSTMIAKSLIDLGVRRLGVATVQEGSLLRKEGITQPILVMGGLLPGQIQELIHSHLTPTLTNEEITLHLVEHLGQQSTPYPIHIKVDTGMGRLGFTPESVVSFLETSAFKKTLSIEGIMTHLSDADNLAPDYTCHQLKQFEALIIHLTCRGFSISLIHAANSAGIMYHPSSHLSMVRPGLMLYGGTMRKTPHSNIVLHPVMKVSTQIVHVRSVMPGEFIGYSRSYMTARPSKIAILPVGYAHGYSRSLSNNGFVLVKGHKVPIVGKICMDMMLIDITNITQATLGEEVVLIGQQGAEKISAEDIAEWAGTIPYEIMCNIGTGSHHVYEFL